MFFFIIVTEALSLSLCSAQLMGIIRSYSNRGAEHLVRRDHNSFVHSWVFNQKVLTPVVLLQSRKWTFAVYRQRCLEGGRTEADGVFSCWLRWRWREETFPLSDQTAWGLFSVKVRSPPPSSSLVPQHDSLSFWTAWIRNTLVSDGRLAGVGRDVDIPVKHVISEYNISCTALRRLFMLIWTNQLAVVHFVVKILDACV